MKAIGGFGANRVGKEGQRIGQMPGPLTIAHLDTRRHLVQVRVGGCPRIRAELPLASSGSSPGRI